MGMNFKPTRMSENELAEITSILFVHLAEEGKLDNVTISEHPSLFEYWSEKFTGKMGSIVLENGKLYRAIKDILDTDTDKPSRSENWECVYDDEVEYPEWVRPKGIFDGYDKGAKTSHKGKNWVSLFDHNFCEPSVFGWKEVS